MSIASTKDLDCLPRDASLEPCTGPVTCNNCLQVVNPEEEYLHCDRCHACNICQKCAYDEPPAYSSRHILKLASASFQDDRLETQQRNKPYVYRPLQEDYVRIIHFEHAQPAQPLDFALHQTSLKSLETSGNYFALSYVWDHTGLSETVICNGATLRISRALVKTILHLYRAGLAVRLWVDAICINQADEDEKARQIPLMKDIYLNATSVIIWLGESDDDTPLAFEVLHSWAATENEDRDNMQLENSQPEADDSQPRTTHVDEAQMRAVMDFFSRSWFTRAWIVQEVGLWHGRCPIAFCGMHHISWYEICLAWSRITKYKLRGGRGRGPQKAPVTCFISDTLMFRRANELKTYLLELLDWARPLQASNPRDKVFALLGLVTGGDLNISVPSPTNSCSGTTSAKILSSTVQIDYRKPVAEVFEEVARAIITTSLSLEVLCFVNRSVSEIDGLPSWVPDWAALPSTNRWRYPGWSRSPLACGSTTALIETSFAEPGVLSVASIHTDVVAEVAEVSLLRDENSLPETNKLIASLWMCFCSNLDSYPNGSSVVEAFWRTILSNVRSDDPRYSVPSDKLGRSFLLLILIMLTEGDMETLVCVRSLCSRPRKCDCCGTEALLNCRLRRFKSGLSSESKACCDSRQGFNRTNSFPDIGEQMLSEMQKVTDELDADTTYFQTVFTHAAGSAMLHRRFFVTAQGYFGLGPRDISINDQVVILKGGPLPFILRPVVDKSQGRTRDERKLFRLVGEAYVHGKSAGEAIAHMQNPETSDEWELVYLK